MVRLLAVSLLTLTVLSATDETQRLLRRAADYNDRAALTRAEKTIAEGLRLAPGNFELERASVEVLLLKGKYAEAAALATRLNKRFPDDVLTCGLLADAQIALQKYDEAEKNVDWMFTLRPPSIHSLERGARLRVILNDPDGALELLGSAYRMTPMEQKDTRARLLSATAEIELEQKKVAMARKHVAEALALIPDFPAALAARDRIPPAE